MGAIVDELAVVRAALSRMPIFPLPSTVLIPGGHLPLHVFEPRYRQMIEDSLAADRVIAVALLEPGWESDPSGRPPIRPTLGAGYIQMAERLPDGRFNLVVHGVLRTRIVEELDSGKPYRLVRAEPVPDQIADGESVVLEEAAQTLRRLVVDLAAVLPDRMAAPLADSCFRERDPGRLADLVGAAVLVDHRLRQEFLEEANVRTRLDRVAGTVAQVLLQVSGGGSGFMM